MPRGVLILLGLALVACQPGAPGSSSAGKPQPLVAGKLDTLPILQNDPEYQALASQYTRDNIELRKTIDKLVKDGKLADQQAPGEYLKRQDELNKKWMKSTNEFVQTRHTKMREAVASICQEKGIDLVVIDSKVYPTVEYGAIDITQEIFTKLYGSPLTGATPKAGGTPK